MQFFGILGIIQKMEQVYMFYMLPKIHLQGIHFKNFIQLFIIFYQSDASIKLKQDSIKDSASYLILDTDISYSKDTIISHCAYSNILRFYLTILSSGTTSWQDPTTGNWISGRNLYILCIDPHNQKIMPFQSTSIKDSVDINIFYIKGKV